MKLYIKPNSKLIQLSAEVSMLLSVSNNSTGNETPGGFNPGTGGSQGGYDGDLTRQQSIWDYWTD